MNLEIVERLETLQKTQLVVALLRQQNPDMP